MTIRWQNSNRDMGKRIKTTLASGCDINSATLQSCKVSRLIWKVHDQPESLCRRWRVVQLICVVKIEIIPQHRNSWCQAIMTILCYPRLFCHLRPSVWPYSCLISDLDSSPWSSSATHKEPLVLRRNTSSSLSAFSSSSGALLPGTNYTSELQLYDKKSTRWEIVVL